MRERGERKKNVVQERGNMERESKIEEQGARGTRRPTGTRAHLWDIGIYCTWWGWLSPLRHGWRKARGRPLAGWESGPANNPDRRDPSRGIKVEFSSIKRKYDPSFVMIYLVNISSISTWPTLEKYSTGWHNPFYTCLYGFMVYKIHLIEV